MAGLIRRADIDEVKSRTNIADIVGDYVTLRSAGVGSMKGLCPFHDEKSPSFNVRPSVGSFHCFGCGEGGGVIDFLMKIDQLTFPEAVERLAQRIGFELHYEEGGGPGESAGNRARLLAANAAAEQFFIAQLATPEAAPGRRFLGERGFDPEAATRFGIGFAPRGGKLGAHLRQLGFAEEEQLGAGLVGKGERGETYDRFRSRLIWPIRDTTGHTVGFGARKLLDEDQGPKYLNTPETAVYKKSQVLYGLDLAKRDIAKQRQVVVVEGYTDVMACHLAGVTTAVATCGTAFGVEHIKVARRVMGDSNDGGLQAAGEVIFTFDPDEAGQQAASRAFAEEQRFAAQTFVAVAPDGLDPCDLRLTRGDDAIRALIQARRPMFEFMIKRILVGFDLEAPEGRVAGLRASAPVVAGIRDEALKVEYSRLLARWLGIDPADALRAVRGVRSQAPRAGGPGSGQPTAPVGEQAGAPETLPPNASLASLRNDPNTRLERDALMAIVQYPQEVGIDLARRALSAAFAEASLAVIRDAAAVSLEHAGAPRWFEDIAAELPAGFQGLLRELAVAPIPAREDALPRYVRAIVEELVDRELLRRKRDALGALQRLDRAEQAERFAELQRELIEIDRQRTAMRGE